MSSPVLPDIKEITLKQRGFVDFDDYYNNHYRKLNIRPIFAYLLTNFKDLAIDFLQTKHYNLLSKQHHTVTLNLSKFLLTMVVSR
jgi:hypothetical protein